MFEMDKRMKRSGEFNIQALLNGRTEETKFPWAPVKKTKRKLI